MHTTINTTILSIFLCLNLIVGLWYGRKVKFLKDYALGGRRFSTAVLTATIVATWYSGFTFYTIANTYRDGLYFSLPFFGGTISLLIVGQLLAVRMGEFLDKLSVAEAMGKLYGKSVQLITAICGLLKSVGVVAIQFSVISKVLTLFFGFSEDWVTIIAASIVIIYSSFGGIRAVTFTDVIQFFVFGTFIPLLVWMIWRKMEDPHQVVYTLTMHPNFNLQKIIGWHPKFFSSLALMLLFMIPAIDPPTFQRIAMASNIPQVKRSFTYAGLIGILIDLLVCSVGVLLLTIDAKLDPDNLVNHILNTYASPLLKSCLGIGILALAMSTADSFLNASSVLFVHDIAKPLQWSLKNETVIARLFSLVVGFFGLLATLYTTDLIKLKLLFSSLYQPIVTVPLLLAVFGFRNSTRSILIGMAIGITIVVVWNLFLAHTGINSTIPGIIGNLIFLLGSHYIPPKKPNTGWKGIKEKRPLIAQQQKRQDAWHNFTASVKNFNLATYLQKILPKQGYFYPLVGFYILATTYIMAYTVEAKGAYSSLEQGIYHVVLFFTTGFILYPIWLSSLKTNYFSLFYWLLGIYFLFFIVGSLLVIISGFQQLPIFILLLNIVVAMLLFDWLFVCTIATSGIFLAVLFMKWYSNALTLPTQLSFNNLYALVLFMGFLGALYKYKKAKQQSEATVDYLQAVQEVKEQERLNVVHKQVQFATALNDEVIASLVTDTKQLQATLKNIFVPSSLSVMMNVWNRIIRKIQYFPSYLKNAFYYAKDYLRLAISEISIDVLLREVLCALTVEGMNASVIRENHSQHTKLQCDVTKIKQLLINSIGYVQRQHAPDHPITLSIADTHLDYVRKSVNITNYTRKIPAVVIRITTESTLPAPKSYYMGNADLPTISIPHTVADLAQTDNECIIDAHYGYTQTVTTASGITQTHVIPVSISTVRPKVMDLPELSPYDTAHHLLEAPLQEKELLQVLERKTKLDLTLIEDTLKLIKKYHNHQRRKSGDIFYTHPMTAVHILLDITQDQDTILAMLLHDTVEDTKLSLAQIEMMFGADVAFIVSKVTHWDAGAKKLILSAEENQHQLTDCNDPRVAYTKLSDRVHNMRTLAFHTSQKQKQIAQETLDFYVWLAEHVGLANVKQELRRRCLAVLNQDEANGGMPC